MVFFRRTIKLHDCAFFAYDFKLYTKLCKWIKYCCIEATLFIVILVARRETVSSRSGIYKSVEAFFIYFFFCNNFLLFQMLDVFFLNFVLVFAVWSWNLCKDQTTRVWFAVSRGTED